VYYATECFDTRGAVCAAVYATDKRALLIEADVSTGINYFRSACVLTHFYATAVLLPLLLILLLLRKHVTMNCSQ
jgi:hypothetical protein